MRLVERRWTSSPSTWCWFPSSSVNDNSILSALLHYLSKEHMDKKGEEINLSMFAKQAMDTPLQQNGSDCGVFCCKVGDYLSRDIQEDVKYFRKRMIFRF